jgi:hypothetical protein
MCQTRRARQKSSSTEPTRDIGPEMQVETRLGDFCRRRQTKPNLGRMGDLGDGISGTHIVRNKPISARHLGRSGPFVSKEPNPARRGEHAKQTQSASAGPPLATECAKQTQSDPAASVVGVKQSQFREGWIDAQVPYRKGIMTVLTHRWPQENKANSQAGSQGRVCQTKPIPGAGLSPASGRVLLGRDEYNGWESFYPVFRRSFRAAGYTYIRTLTLRSAHR